MSKASSQKKKIMQGMSVYSAKKKMQVIVAEKWPGLVIPKHVWQWMEVWFHLRAHSDSFDIICQAFAEKVKKLHKEKRLLEQRIHNMRAELSKRLREIDDFKRGGASKEGVER